MQFFTSPPRPADESRRIACLHALGALDTPADPALDAMVKEAAAIYDAPIGLVSLVDSRRQWFKARHGLDATETPRAVSFCGHAILDAEPLIVLDARSDERFGGNPLVLNAPNVVFYAGAPLIVRGEAMGTLCVIDREPRSGVTGAQVAQHKLLARRVAARLQETAPA